MPHLETIAAFEIHGLSCRSSNAAEMDHSHPERARIAPLWQDFSGSGLQGEVFGAYFDYVDRHHGEYSVIAGIKGAPGQARPAAAKASVQVPAGRYLVFEAKGELPAALIQAWGQVWACFEQEGAAQRAYGVDFERYLEPGHAQIYIGLRD